MRAGISIKSYTSDTFYFAESDWDFFGRPARDGHRAICYTPRAISHATQLRGAAAIAGRRCLSDLSMRDLLKYSFAKLSWMSAHSKNVKSVEVFINNQIEALEFFQNAGIRNYSSFFKASLTVGLTTYELGILIDRFFKANKKFEKGLFTRLLALTIIEFLDNINKITVRDLISDLEKNDMTSCIDPIKRVGKKFSRLKSNNESYLREVRNFSAAHRLKDSYQMIQFISKLDVMQILNLSAEVIEVAGELTKEVTEILEVINNQLRAKK